MKPHPLRLLPLLALALLAGCVSDAASLQIDGKEHSLSLVREQKWLWENTVQLAVVATRIPECQRRHRMKTASIANAIIDVFSADAATFTLKQGNRYYSVETTTCEAFKELAEAPADPGLRLGTFKEVDGKFSFVENPAAFSTTEAPTAQKAPVAPPR